MGRSILSTLFTLAITLPGNCCYGSLSGAETAGALPNSLKKLSLTWVPNGGEVMKLLRAPLQGL